MTARVTTPRRVFLSVAELCRLLRTTPQALYPYLVPTRDGWRLRPLAEWEYERWHERTGARR